VLSTPHLIGWVETCGHDAISGTLQEGQGSVGTVINIRHLAATPVGMTVRIRVELLEVDRRRLLFRVEAWDELDKILEGEHERFITDTTRFEANLAQKTSKWRERTA
jgi:predicted thioesterase